MSNVGKKFHFAMHQLKQEDAKVKQLYQDQHCPVCEMDFSTKKLDEIIHHCLKHTPGQVQYCDRCGLNLKDCNQDELSHHHHSCRLAKDRPDGDPEPVICKTCGLHLTTLTSAERLKQQKDCHQKNKGTFCAKCGLDMSAPNWNRAAIAKHDSHCMPPSGFRKNFCQKCRTELATLDDIGVSHHQRTCRRVEPAVQSGNAGDSGMLPFLTA